MTARLDTAVADLQGQLAECRAERDAGLAREAALAEVLQTTNSSPGDLTPVFDAILAKAHVLCGVEHGALAAYDGKYFRVAADRGMPQFLVKQRRQPFLRHPRSSGRQNMVDQGVIDRLEGVYDR